MIIAKKIEQPLFLLFICASIYAVEVIGAENHAIVREWGVSAQQGRRDTMEDRFYVERKNGSFFGMYDGHGGQGAADYVKMQLVRNFDESEEKTIAEKLKKVFIKTDKDFLANFSTDYSGTTAVVAVVDAVLSQLVIANCGDSRALLIRNNRIIVRTRDHKPGDEQEYYRIEKAGGLVFYDTEDNCFRLNNVLAVSRAIGDRYCNQAIPEPDIYQCGIQSGDLLVLMTDGVTDVMKNREIADFIVDQFDKKNENADVESEEDSNSYKLNLIARALVNEAYERGSCDNITALIVKFKARNQENRKKTG